MSVRAKTAPLVLVVDDLEEYRAACSELLVEAGLRVAEASDGEHALMKAHTLLPDVVVMDLGLPALDGWSATRELKTHRRTKHIPVVAITGQSTRDALRRAREAGADVVLTKDCEPEDLVGAIRKLLDDV